MKYALAFIDHTGKPHGPIPRSLFQESERQGIPILYASRKEDWDDYDLVIWFHNRPPTMETTAKVAWWMCDARTPQRVIQVSEGVKGTADYVFLCNTFLLQQYEEVFDVKSFHMPQCGDDMPSPPCVFPRSDDCVFIGHVPTMRLPKATKLLGMTHQFFDAALLDVHSNRLPVIEALRAAGITVEIIQGERATKNQKSIYRSTPFCLAISPPIPGYTSNRMYNILSAGGFCLTLKYPGIEDQFQNHKHLVWFESVEEAIDLINHYKARRTRMNQIRNAGLEEYLKNHTAARRLQQMIGLVEK